ncbi:MAG: TldD/PmbA family protein [Firmicutes bacterium]|nr:TldD/PmbA family protein [Bacillota bacterium]
MTVLEVALDTARRAGATYADARSVRLTEEALRVKNGAVEHAAGNVSKGIGVRVIAGGSWGFAAGSIVTESQAAALAARAVEIAQASALSKKADVVLAPETPVVAEWHGPCEVDPWKVSLGQKVDLLREACARARSGGPDVRVVMGTMSFVREEKTFASTEGAYITQSLVASAAGVSAIAVGSGEVQIRSYPGTFEGNVRSAGYEWVESLDLPGHARKVGEEAQSLITAQQCPSMTTTLVLGTNQLALQIHESCGHPTELDRVLGTEASYAGTSFLTPDMLGSFRYGSDLVNLTADATLPGGLGTFGYDDEGVPAARTPLVRHGVFVGYLTSRETASRFGMRSNGTMRATGWDRMPLIRMTNISLEPGPESLESLIRGTDDGVFMDGIKSWSIDDRRVNFQFGTEIAWRIRRGELAEVLKNPTYTGITYEFWRSCDGIAGPDEWVLWGVPNCGKGQPTQIARVGHGASPARFRNVRVGVGRW